MRILQLVKLVLSKKFFETYTMCIKEFDQGREPHVISIFVTTVACSIKTMFVCEMLVVRKSIFLPQIT